MTEAEQREAARQFYYTWKDRGDEKSDCQSFWNNLLTDVLGMDDVANRVVFEKRVIVDGQTKFIDVFIPESRVLIEQKSLKKELSKEITQSGGTELTPYQQAKRYADNLPFDEKPRWIVVSNFAQIRIHDMNTREPEKEYISIQLGDIQSEYHRLKFLLKEEEKIASKEVEISVQAGNIVGQIYDALLEQYADKTNADSLKSLNKLCVRLVFCMYAEDSGLFGNHLMFHDYMSQYDAKSWRKALIDLFRVLDTKVEDRDKYLEDDLAAFPYVNGGLFAEEDIEIPKFTDDIVSLILEKGCEFDWSEISPTIFGAVFESTLNPETRRSGGMHYTSIENIHKVIDPLFLDDLKKELEEIKQIGVLKQRKDKAKKFQDKLAGLTFLDPACGSGNFLTESYISLRKLENEAIMVQTGGQISLGEIINPIQVSIGQFYGIEINDFAVTVGKTALWIAEHQMMKATESIVHMQIDFLPLKSYANIVKANALRIDWETVVPVADLSYIMGNPPFVGQQLKSKEQSEDMALIFGKGTPETKLDYVLCWYMKSMEYIQKCSSIRPIHVAFVSTNSICQGESVPTFWNRLCEMGAEIFFAHRSFKWGSDSLNEAKVVCVIVGFTNTRYLGQKYIFENGNVIKADHINAYLHNAPDIWIVSRKNIPPTGFPKMIKGSEPTDGGDLFFTPDERASIIKAHPDIENYIKPFVGGDEYLSNQKDEYSRYCLWLYNEDPTVCAGIKELKERFVRIEEKRLASSADRIQKRAEYPYLFCQIRQPSEKYLIFPRHSSGDRRYIPIGYMSENVIVGDACYIIPNASLYLFGILTSNVHMSWMRLVCGRLGNGYRYSPAIYNNFPFPNATDEQKTKIEKTAQAILDAREKYSNKSLAALYDPHLMPPELKAAHNANNAAVMQAYGFPIRETDEEKCVEALMNMYQENIK